MTENCIECETPEEAKKQEYCRLDPTCGFYEPLKGEGEVETVTRMRKRHLCDSCNAPATQRVTFLLLNSRRNPRSAGYGGDDISRCSDYAIFACEECKVTVRRSPPSGHDWCAMYPLDRFPHMGLYWERVKE